MFPGNILTTKSFEVNNIAIDFMKSTSENYVVKKKQYNSL